MQNIITDTHYDSRNRMNRHLGFISTIQGKGIAAEDYTAICIYQTEEPSFMEMIQRMITLTLFKKI